MGKIIKLMMFALILSTSGCCTYDPRLDILKKADEFQKNGFSHAAYVLRQQAQDEPGSRLAFDFTPDENLKHEVSQIVIAPSATRGPIFLRRIKYRNILELY
jgi:hypothetical protein